MPRLNPFFERAVFFLYRRNPETGQVEGPVGTGSCIGMRRKGAAGEQPLRHVYAVTNYHVALGKTCGTIIRINTIDGRSRSIETEPHEWHFIAKHDDLAAIDITETLDALDDVYAIPDHLFLTKQLVNIFQIGIGEDGFMLGLFSEQTGADRNMIAARFGNISLLAHDDAPIPQPHGVVRPSHIFDMRSRPGFSGSPVFIYRTPSGDLTESHRPYRMRTDLWVNRNPVITAEEEWEQERRKSRNTFLRLLGVHAGQYPETVEVKRLKKAKRAALIRDGEKLQIPSSMTVVVPAWEVANLLNEPHFVEQRSARESHDAELMPGRP